MMAQSKIRKAARRTHPRRASRKVGRDYWFVFLLWLTLLVNAGCGGSKNQPANSDTSISPQSKKLDETKEATNSFPAYADQRVKELAPAYIGRTRKLFFQDEATFEYKVEDLRVRRTDVRKSNSLSNPIVGIIEVDVTWKLVTVTNFPRKFVPYSSEAPIRRVNLECVWRGSVWELKSLDDVSKEILTLGGTEQ